MKSPLATIDTNERYRLTISLEKQNGCVVTKEEVEVDQNLILKTANIYYALSWKGHESNPCSEGFIEDVYKERGISLLLPSARDETFSLILSVIWFNSSGEVLYDQSKRLSSKLVKHV